MSIDLKFISGNMVVRASAGSWTISQHYKGGTNVRSGLTGGDIDLPFEVVDWYIDKCINEGKTCADLTQDNIPQIAVSYNQLASPKEPVTSRPPAPPQLNR